MAKFRSLDIWTDSWLADTGHLPRIDRDIYFHLMILMWRTPGCRVPNEIVWIARHLKVSEGEIPALNSVISEFCSSDGNWLKQKRLTKEYRLAVKRSRKSSVSAKTRWDKEKADANAMPSTVTVTDTVTVEESKAPLSPPRGAVVLEKGFRNGRRRKQGYSIRESFYQAVEHIEAREQKGGAERSSGDLKLLS